MISRRNFLKAATVAAVAAGTGCTRLKSIFARKSYKLRTVTYNVYACYGWTPDEAKFKERRKAAKDKAFMSDMARRFADALRPLEADIITFQESPAEWVVEEIARQLKMGHIFFPSCASYPGAVITNFDVVEKQNCPIVGGVRPKDLFTRHWGRAVLSAPFGNLILHSAHLHPSDAAVRRREVTEVLKAMKGDFRSGLPLVFQGDFNHTDTQPEYKQWADGGLVDLFRRAGVGSEITMPLPTKESPKRIDYIWSYGWFAKHVREVCVIRELPFSLDPNNPESIEIHRQDARATFALSDHLPIMATFV
jgi:endonuclease/exonuclease/phosphatase family metal-dependent hydrolase